MGTATNTEKHPTVGIILHGDWAPYTNELKHSFDDFREKYFKRTSDCRDVLCVGTVGELHHLLDLGLPGKHVICMQPITTVSTSTAILHRMQKELSAVFILTTDVIFPQDEASPVVIVNSKDASSINLFEMVTMLLHNGKMGQKKAS